MELTAEDTFELSGCCLYEVGCFLAPLLVNNISRKSRQTQFPDTPYGFESGGDPEAIPELTYEKFLAFHSKYYHPANSK